MNFFLLIVMLFATMSLSSGLIAGWGQGPKQQSKGPDFYCGRKLAMELAAICFSDYDDNNNKRSGTMYGNLLRPYYERENRINQIQEFEWPWIKPHKAREVSLRTRGKRDPGVVEECCDKPCTMDELLTYC